MDSQEYEQSHGGWSFGERNEEGEYIPETALAHYLVVAKIIFPKGRKHLVTYQTQG